MAHSANTKTTLAENTTSAEFSEAQEGKKMTMND